MSTVKTGVVRYYPGADEKGFQDICKRHERKFLSAKVVKDNGDGTADIVVSPPDAPSENRLAVPFKKSAKGKGYAETLDVPEKA